MNRLLKTMLGIVICFSISFPVKAQDMLDLFLGTLWDLDFIGDFYGTDTYDGEVTALAALLKNPAGYAGRSPFSSPGVYEVDFKNYASQNSMKYRTVNGGGSESLVFDNGVVPDNLMGYDCKFVASFKNQILKGYAYQSVVLNREQAESLAQKLASELMGMGNVDRATGFSKSSDALYSEQYLYGAGTRVTVDARQVNGRFLVSLIVSITHF